MEDPNCLYIYSNECGQGLALNMVDLCERFSLSECFIFFEYFICTMYMLVIV